jgi:hypothetical protein
MAQYLLIEFDSDEEANAVYDQVDANKGQSMRVVGKYLHPGYDLCRCGDANRNLDGSLKAGTVYRDAKSGMMVCLVCRKIMESSFGCMKNQVEPQDIDNPHTFNVAKKGNMPALRGMVNSLISLHTRDASFFKKNS